MSKNTAAAPANTGWRHNRAARVLALCILLMLSFTFFQQRITAAEAEAIVARDPIAVPHISTAKFDQVVLQSKLPVLLQFDAKWCPYCRKFAPTLAQFAADHQGEVAVYAVDVDEEPNLKQLFGVSMLPTLVLVKDGTFTGKIEGVKTAPQLQAFIAQ